MTTYSRPGVFVQEVALPQAVNLANNSAAIGAFVGSFSQGTTSVPVLVNTWSDFVNNFGGLNDSYPATWAAYSFFANGGRQLYVKRIVGSGAVSAFLDITDNAAEEATAFRLTAVSAGTWANDYSVQIVPAGESGRFGLNLFVSVVQNGATVTVPVETYTDLSMDSTDRHYVLTVINSYSKLLKIVASSVDNEVVPYTGATTPTSLASGTNGPALVRADYATAWTTFDSISNSIVLYAPDAAYAASGTLTSQIHGDAVSYAATRTDAFVIIDTSPGLGVEDAKDEIAATAAIFAGDSSGNIAAAYYPWVNIPDPTKVPGATRLQAPGAAVLGQYLATDASRGPAKTPAGLNNKIALAVSTDHQFTNAELDDINTNSLPINAIRQVPGAGIVIMGGRTLDSNPNNRYINIRRSLIYVEKQLQDLTSFAVFENNDSRLWAQIRTTVGSFLLNYWSNGGLRGSSPTQAYYVKCDSTINTFADIQAGRVNIEVGVALQYPAEFVVIKLGQLTGNATA
jgi:phage tail sheath protein FI